MRLINSGIGLLAASGLVLAASAVEREPRRRVPGPKPRTDLNRWTGKPHEHRREIARRSRQASRQGGR